MYQKHYTLTGITVKNMKRVDRHSTAAYYPGQERIGIENDQQIRR